jgi:hypothetical protein
MMCAARLISSTGKVPLNHVMERRMDAEDALRAQGARDRLARADLEVAPAGQHFSWLGLNSRHGATHGDAVVLDDADLFPSCSPETVSTLAQAGSLVILTLPRHLMVHGENEDADLDPSLAGWLTSSWRSEVRGSRPVTRTDGSEKRS